MICVRRLDSVDVRIIVYRVFFLRLFEKLVSLLTPAAFGSFIADRLFMHGAFAASGTVGSLLRGIKKIKSLLIALLAERGLGLLNSLLGARLVL